PALQPDAPEPGDSDHPLFRAAVGLFFSPSYVCVSSTAK
ncbi:PREDICTED: galactose-1-phosphate uridylyltransferase-like, partial [Chlamydotis macqueenii]